MEAAVPMDRLVCGDVGYGKTEIAVRAAFKAVTDGKQVAVLVPTTLLVQQHFATFSERYAAFPVTVKAVSRFNTAKRAEGGARRAGRREVDVVIGTHRLLSAGTKFKDLGPASSSTRSSASASSTRSCSSRCAPRWTCSR